MADVATRFKAFLEADTSIKNKLGNRVYQDRVSEQSPVRPYLWFSKRLTNYSNCIDDSNGAQPTSVNFDVESISTDLTESQAIAELVRTRCHLYRGAFDDSTVKAVFVRDQKDDYVPQGAGSNDGLFATFFDVEVFL